MYKDLASRAVGTDGERTGGAAIAGARRLSITWEHHRRTREVAKALNLQLHEVISHAGRPARYVPLALTTVALLLWRRPDVVFVQCPSVPLACLVLLLKGLLGYRVVADLHNEAVRPFNFNARSYLSVLRWIWRRADLNIVTNAALESTITREGGRTFVLPDPVPTIGRQPDTDDHDRTPIVVCISSFASDEPYASVIETARLLPGVRFFLTGDPARAQQPIVPTANVELTGYLADDAYERLLQRADVIVDLTEMEDCLVCGGYEAVALEKPLVTSRTRALREFFSAGTVHSGHSPTELAAAVRDALGRRESLAAEMHELKIRLSERWHRQGSALEQLMVGEI